MVWVMVAVRSRWEVDGVVVVFRHECMVYYAFVCTLAFTCGQVYNDVVVFFMHEVMVCVVDMVMH